MTLATLKRMIFMVSCVLAMPLATSAADVLAAPTLQGTVGASVYGPRRIAATSSGQFVVLDAQGGAQLLTKRGDLVGPMLNGVRAVTAGSGRVFAVTGDVRLVTLDDRFGRVQRSVALGVGEAPVGLSYDGARDLVWMAYRSGMVEGRRTDGSVAARANISGRLVDVAVDASAGVVWVVKDRPAVGGMLIGLDAATAARVRAVGDESGPVALAGALAVGANGAVYLTDFFAGTIEVLSSSGTRLQSIALTSGGAGAMTQPSGLGFMANGDILVSKLYASRLDRYGDGSPLPVCEGDSDCDGMSDGWEVSNGLNPLSAADALLDGDVDGLGNLEEFALATNPGSGDSDGDGYPDAEELANGFNPADPTDHRLMVAGASGEYAPGIVPLSASVRTGDAACSAVWTQTGGDRVALQGAEGFAPTFVARKAGAYRFTVVANCAGARSEPAEIVANVLNVAPVADAPRVVVVDAGESVRLAASRSSDANGDALTFDWTQLSGMAVTGGSSQSTLSAQIGAAGSYQFKVTVADAARATGEASTHVVALGATPVPSASVVTPVVGEAGQSIALDASGSHRGEGAVFAWQQVAGTQVALAASGAGQTSFVAPAPGRYAFQVTVSQGGVSSPPAVVEVFVGASGALPVAVAAAPSVAAVGAAVSLDGSGSTGAAEYAWRQVSGPAAGLGSPGARVASAHLFMPGSYEFELTVSDGPLVGVPSRVRVEARKDGKAIPVARVKAARTARVGEQVVLDGRGSTGARTFRWTQVGGPWVALDGGAVETFRPSSAGTYVFELEVDDGQVRSAPARVSVLVDDGMEG